MAAVANKESTLTLIDAWKQPWQVKLAENETLESIFDTIAKQHHYTAAAMVLKYKGKGHSAEFRRLSDGSIQMRQTGVHPTNGSKDKSTTIYAKGVLAKQKFDYTQMSIRSDIVTYVNN